MATSFKYNTVVLSESEYLELLDKANYVKLLIKINNILSEEYDDELTAQVVKCIAENLV